jgi:DNA polymerase-3 subunit delta'
MKFSEIPGQQELKQRLIRSVMEHRVSHAQLFLGSTGNGSLAMAIAYAQYICCTGKTDHDSCGTCMSCLKYQKLIHPDLHFAYPMLVNKKEDKLTSTDVIALWREAVLENPYMNSDAWFDYLGVENQQPIIAEAESGEILRKLSLTTYESEYKVMIIWLAERMNQVTANKLLKILEEPPDKTLFLLICENEDQLLRTLVSRTQLVKVNKIDEPSLEKRLQEVHQLGPDEARGIAQLSDGNYGVARRLMEEHESAGLSLETFQNWMRACLKLDILKINSRMQDFHELGRERQKNYLGYCLHMVRECVMINYADSSLVNVTSKEMEFLAKFSPFINAGNCLPFTEELNKAYVHIERNANPKLLFLDLSIRFNGLLNTKLA